MSRQPWLHSAAIDTILILSPPFLALLVAFSLNSASMDNGIPPWAWLVFIVGIDVAHVWSTLFRTYLDHEAYEERKLLFLLTPLACWLLGLMLYTLSGALFWTALAYLAVFHFARQAYGFLMLYSRSEAQGWGKRLDQAFIYLATLYPILYWHAHLPRNFHWFIDGDFASGCPEIVATCTGYLYLLVIAAYLAKEAKSSSDNKPLNIPKQLVLLGTAASWYVGIVALNGDFIFTVTNVVAHGIPYIGLVWLLGRKQSKLSPERYAFMGLKFSRVYSLAFLPVFLGLLFFLGFLEEGLWDALHWREHTALFPFLSWLPKVLDKGTLAWLVPLLALPQATHYVLDGFIWRLHGQTKITAVPFTKE